MSTDLLKRNIIFYSIIAVVIIGIYSYKSYRKMDFQRDADQFTENSLKLCAISYKMCNSISQAWEEYSWGNYYFDTQTGKTDNSNTGNRANNLVYCSTTSELLMLQEDFFISTGVVDLLNEYKNNMDIAFKRLESAQGKYENVFKSFEEIYIASNTIYDLATKPNGSLDNYNSSVYSGLGGISSSITYEFRGLDFEMCPIFNERAKEYQRSANDEFFKKTGIECNDFLVF